MALYVDGAYLDEIEQVAAVLPIAGVTTNPTILLNTWKRGQHLGARELLQQLLERVSGDIFMQPSIASEEDGYREAMGYIEIAPERILPKIPLTQTGMKIAMRLKKQGVRLAFTAVTSVAQAYAAGLLGAEFIIPYYNRMLRNGIQPAERISCMAKIFQDQQLPTRILAASIKSSVEAAQALAAGAHDLTVPPEVLLTMVTEPDTEEAVERFEKDSSELRSL
ncbi:fructose-6-phosphate aldolase 1 [Thermosporothrix hazakensis]|jgi:TalC/MipB family fructose-6-phosphate aldolase|uniref:Fructose-6-phosphate aldolase 1 n=2 Tax=Thermosporothrix TaxID=768650 RepID=A0A326UFU6_THEHA|nr:transaldolase family protein [Thermosporothrix hazakensis]PZW36824.1 fructose-6-phosphate aldolase 1 [Thermosporothrix hazakensis]BBH89290.1 transaldolase [Thermosporothrix sp. COM3]GCE47473.1 transaldolase [Thermosporothrix hazakensis]